jgi:hypothetical protein
VHVVPFFSPGLSSLELLTLVFVDIVPYLLVASSSMLAKFINQVMYIVLFLSPGLASLELLGHKVREQSLRLDRRQLHLLVRLALLHQLASRTGGRRQGSARGR